ncbi:MAG: hypothetical protein M0C28_47535 [Candidatus Moduliflexus flocculans]|nr:hypothetical protein [Candidatus Moduliflexus flocculans]
MMLLRHEAGHAVNYAYRLWRRPSWGEIFGALHQALPGRLPARPAEPRTIVRHIAAYPYGRTYAQKHPDEDFAETFAVWLTPRSAGGGATATGRSCRKLALRRPADEGRSAAAAAPRAAAACACGPSSA